MLVLVLVLVLVLLPPLAGVLGDAPAVEGAAPLWHHRKNTVGRVGDHRLDADFQLPKWR